MSHLDLSPLHNGFRFTWEPSQITGSVTRVAERSGALHGELSVYIPVNGQPKLLIQGGLNLSSLQTRERMAKRLVALKTPPDLDGWNTFIERLCVKVVQAYREGQPAETLEPQPDDEPTTFVCNPLVYERHPTLLYGPGESGKSFFALYVACVLASGGTSTNLAVAPEGWNVLYLDWELRAPEMRGRVKQLRAAHPELKAAPLHKAMHTPLVNALEEIRTVVHDQDIGIVVIDSLGPATGGDIERAPDPVSFFNALNSLEVSSLLIGHVAKGQDEDKARTPYGSVYYYNLARSIFEVRLSSDPDSDERRMALYHRKNNLGRRLSPLGYTLTVTDTSARFDSFDPTEDVELTRGLPLRERIKKLLDDGQERTTEDIQQELTANASSCRWTLNRYKGKDWQCLTEGGGRGKAAQWVRLTPS